MSVNTAKTDNKQEKLALLQTAYDVFQKVEDDISAEKVIDLYEKLHKEEFIISFTGHFSAGKSSIINFLLNKDVLPKSPIPTSANIVKLTSGEGVARFHFKDAISLEYDEPYDIDLVKEYAKDKDTIKQIEISTSEAILPKNSVLMDTPGIDAADDADRLMTESALHTIDELFYVMDYNHVQSEVNMLFLREMKEQEIPVSIIINQIDKHNSTELSFSAFKESVKQTFDQWKVKVKNIYFTSAFQLDIDNNDILKLKEDVFHALTKRPDNEVRFQAAFQQIVTEHEQFLLDNYEQQAENLLYEFSPEVADQVTDIQTSLKELNAIEDEVHRQFMDEVQLTLKNAYLMPAKLRDLAEVYLQAEQKDFKVGFFQAKKKTNEERIKRMESFLTLLQETIDSTIVWKLKEKFNEFVQAYQLQDESLQNAIEEFTVVYDEKNAKQFMKTGATINGNYILNYTNDISNDIKNKFRTLANELWSIFKRVITTKNEEIKTHLHEHLASLQVNETIIEQRNALEQSFQSDLQQLKHQLNSFDSHISTEGLLTLVEKRRIVEKAEAITAINHEKQREDDDQLPLAEQHQLTYDANTITAVIDDIVTTIENSEGFQTFIDDLQIKKGKLLDRQLTIALFGAFSAGKSSFANALLANRVLPVSPNPTTAVINRIHPINQENSHGEVVLHFKAEEALFEDLIRITADFSPDVDNLKDLIHWIETKHIQHHPQLNNMYQAYLKAILAGYDANKSSIGSTLTIDLEAFAAFVTDESKACYLEMVDLYYDCPLTRKGITLVDTPGADSVNARHTNVSFDYIKEADAILYVTYYNHAVTSADRDFLMQLGRVKEAFELDKMFFIVNAADLAQTDEDLQLVLKYVEEQLVKLGIRQAKIYPLSSKLTLEEKLANQVINEQFTAFEDNFNQFIEKDLVALTIESTVWDIERLQNSLDQMIEAASLPTEEKATYRQNIATKQTEIEQIITDVESETIRAMTRIHERIERQLHFVLERLYIRFHDMFAEYFNPTTITAAGREGQEQIKKQRNEFIHYVGYELLQEVRAVSIRLEAYMNQLLTENHQMIQEQVKRVDPHFLLRHLEKQSFETASYEEAFQTIDYELFNKALKVFRNLKSFFEKNERENMKELFFESLQPEAATYIKQNEALMKQHYEIEWKNGVELMKTTVLSELHDYADNQLRIINDDIDIDLLEKQRQTVKDKLKNIH